MGTPKCEKCKFRATYDRNPRSLLGRIWRWHAGWCPGWRGYMRSLPPEERARLARQYDLKQYVSTPAGKRM